MSGKKPLKVPKTLPKRDHHMRTGYLYQLGVLNEAKREGIASRESKTASIISRMYVNHMDQVSKKAVLKLHPDLKRTVCKKCCRIGIPGLNVKIRIVNESKKEDNRIANVLEYQCVCGGVKRFPYGQNEGYELFVEREGKCFNFDRNSNSAK